MLLKRFRIVLSIIVGLLVIVLVIPQLIHSHECAKCGRALYDINTINTEISVYYEENGSLPSKLSLLTKIYHKDPWGNSYRYSDFSNGNYSCFLVWTFGSDNRPGGTEIHEMDTYLLREEGQCLTIR